MTWLRTLAGRLNERSTWTVFFGVLANAAVAAVGFEYPTNLVVFLLSILAGMLVPDGKVIQSEEPAE